MIDADALEPDEPLSTDPLQGSSAQHRRLEFIEFRLLWEGKINRSELVRFFGVSIQQASLDFARYMVLAEDNMEYDRSEKVYRATPRFKPRFVVPELQAQAYLNQVALLTSGVLSPLESFVGTRPPCAVVTLPVRRVHWEILQSVLLAIRDRTEIEVTYQSMRHPVPIRRWIAPHSLAFDGARWHTRAWCHQSQAFRDFVLTRIQAVHDRRPSTIDPSKDSDWETYAVVVLEPRSDLSTAQRDSVITDFGMTHGKLLVSIRRALVQYLVRHLQVEGSGTAWQPIVWANRDELADLVEPGRRY
jgi:predicted DNA-binding transcriptional regulator YafY